CPASEPLESHQAQLPPEGIAHQLTARPAGLLAEPIKEPFQIRVQSNGDDRSHVIQCTTEGRLEQPSVHPRRARCRRASPQSPWPTAAPVSMCSVCERASRQRISNGTLRNSLLLSGALE